MPYYDPYDPLERRRAIFRMLRDMARSIEHELAYYESVIDRIAEELLDLEKMMEERLESIRRGVMEPYFTVIDRGSHLEVVVDVSGAKKETINITVTRDSIEVEAETDSRLLHKALGDTIHYRGISRIEGRIRLPTPVDPSKITWERRGPLIVFKIPKEA